MDLSPGDRGWERTPKEGTTSLLAISIPPLIDRETFERSQARHEPNQQFSRRNLHQERWLLRRLVRCEKCGLKCVCVEPSPAVPYYRCGKQIRQTDGVPCRPNHIRAEPLDKLVWQEIRRHLLAPDLLLKAQTALTQSASLDASWLTTHIDHTRKRLTQVNAERRRLLDVYQGGFIDQDEFEGRVSQVNRRRAELQADLESLEQENQYVGASRSLSARLHHFASAITQRLDTMAFHERQTLVRSVLEEIVINDNLVKLYLKIPCQSPIPILLGPQNPASTDQCPHNSICVHALVLDGVYRTPDSGPVFHAVRAPTAEQLQALLIRMIKRLVRLLTRKGYVVEEQEMMYLADRDSESALTPLQAAACTRGTIKGCVKSEGDVPFLL